MLRDLRYALRTVVNHRGLTLGIVICLALGTGATTAVFSTIHAVMLRPMPFEQAERLLLVFDSHLTPGEAQELYQATPPNFETWQEEAGWFEEIAAIRLRDINLIGDGDPERLAGAEVSAAFFPVLGAQPLIGRSFGAAEDQAGAPARVVVVSYGLWQRRFGADPKVLGKRLRLDGESYDVIGVMPQGFRFPEGIESATARDLWIPLGLDVDETPRRFWHHLIVVARLRPEIPLARAQASMDTIAQRLAQERPNTNTGWGCRLVPLRQALVRPEVRSGLLLLLLAVGFVLLIACANVASMLLARATNRTGEIALRLALGASRGRLVRQLLTESVLLALLGGAAGLLLVQLAVPRLAAMSPLELASFQNIRIDLYVLGFTLVTAITTGILFGLASALQLTGTELAPALRQTSLRSTAGVLGRRLQDALLVFEMALVLVLLVGAGLMIRSFQRLREADPGFETENLLTLRLSVPPSKYPEAAQHIAYLDRIVERVKGLPGVRSSSVSFLLPIGDPVIRARFTVEGRQPAEPGEDLATNHRLVSHEYFETIGLPILRGRGFTELDHRDAPGVAVVSQELARRYWPGQNPIGRRVKRGNTDSDQPWLTVVGVAEDVRDNGLTAEVAPTWYLPFTQHGIPDMRLVVKTDLDPGSTIAPVREAIWAIDSDQTISEISTVAELVAGSLS